MNAKNKHSAGASTASGQGPIYVDAAGEAHLLIDLDTSDYRAVDESEEGSGYSASPKEAPEYVFRRFDMPSVFKRVSGQSAVFANPEHRRYEGKAHEPLLPSETAGKWAEFETILGDIRDDKDAALFFSRLIPDIRRIMKASPEPIDGIRNALCYRDAKTQSTLVSALYRYSNAPLARRVRDFAFSIGIEPYEARELAAAKIEGYCRHFRSPYASRSSSFVQIRELCDRISSGAYADMRNSAGESLFSLLAGELSSRLNHVWAARALDVLLNELTDVHDPKVDPIDPFQQDAFGRTLETRIMEASDEARLGNFATVMLAELRGFFSETARYGRTTSFSSVPPEEVAGIRAKVAKGYSEALQ